MKNSKILPIRKLRESRTDMNQESFAETVLHISTKAYANYENGLQAIPSDILIKLSDYYKVSIDYLLGRSDFTTDGNKYISEVTGLSDKAINRLRKLNEADKDIEFSNIKNVFKDSSSVSPVMIRLRIPIINFILESKRLTRLLDDFSYFLDSDRYTTLIDDSFHQIKNSHGLINKHFYPADKDLIAGSSEIRIDSDTHKALAKNLLDIHLMKLSEEFKKKKPS